MKLFKSILAVSLTLSLSACFDEPEGESSQWYRDIRTHDWAWSGAKPKELERVLNTIENISKASGNLLDKNIVSYLPGNWEYEWDKAGNTASVNKDYLAASIYHTVAAYPFIYEEELSRKSYMKAIANYKKAVQQAGFDLERVALDTEDGKGAAYLHLPEVKGSNSSQPLPVIIVTNGSDHAMTQVFTAYEQFYSKAGFAMISFDLPGLGINGGMTQQASRTNVLHQAVIKFIQSDVRFDGDKVVLLAKSFGGNAAVKTAFTNEQDIAAVVSWCGAVNDPFLDLDHTLEVIEPMTVDALVSRFDMPASELAKQWEHLALSSHYLGKKTTSVPILSINHANDPVNPLSDMELVTSASLNGSIAVIDEEVNQGHCSSESATLPQIMKWLELTI